MLKVAMSRGARVFDAQAKNYDAGSGSVIVEMDDGVIVEAKQVVLATGYVMPDFVKSDLHDITSSFAIATPPQPESALWRNEVLIWEAAENYLYLRTTSDHRIVVGGEDDKGAAEPGIRDSVMPKKAEAILRRLKTLWPAGEATAEYVWSGAFGITADGLPLIGPVPGHPRIYAAYGYGGNGITFSYLAAQMIGELIAGQPRPWFDDFAIDRPNPKG
jgi:glycine/D-amino acid oxidase-like deaminating enzyme